MTSNDGQDNGFSYEDLTGASGDPSGRGDLMQRLDADIDAAGGPLQPDARFAGSVGATMFDLPSSEDGTVSVLLPREHLRLAHSQALVRLLSGDNRRYLGVVTAGPFAEPDSIRGDSRILVTVATRGGIYLPPYHGRVQVAILGEEGEDGSLRPPLLRPLPNSAVHVLSETEAAAVLGSEGDMRLGLASSYLGLEVRVPSNRKDVFPRHTAVLGTTGGGKSTTIANLVCEAQAAGMAVILLDVEGEYTFLHEATSDAHMLAALASRGLTPGGIPAGAMTLYHLVGRDTANPDHPNLREFSPQFAHLSPYAVAEILDLNEPQRDRFHRAYDILKMVMRDLGIFPAWGNADQERLALEIDEFERGYPRMTLRMLMDVVAACLAIVEKEEPDPLDPRLASADGKKALQRRLGAAKLPGFPASWRALLGKLAQLNRLKVFDMMYNVRGVQPLDYHALLMPGMVSVIDLSDAGMSELSNIVIADLLHGVQDAQDTAYDAFERARREGTSTESPSRVLIIIEEAHEFLSSERIDRMNVTFEQVARIAKRGRKRWLGLVFVTQLPQHLPRQVFGLVNSYILHKITDPLVVRTLQQTVSGIDEGLWRRLSGLAPGQAIVSFPHMTLPLLVSMDPTPAQLRLVD
jgi:uncharacterized protein